MILGIDTSGPVPAVAMVEEGGAVVFARSSRRPRAHAEELAALVREATAVGRPAAVAVGRGPGGFTGLRVGLVTGATLAWAQGLPIAGFCSLDVVAVQNGLVDGWVVMDARRGELFLARYSGARRVSGPAVATRTDAAGLIGAAPAVGDTALLVSAQRRDRGSTLLDPGALAVVSLAAVTADAVQPPEPIYLRRPDVTVSPASAGTAP